jgi:hypothetical protein
MSHHDHIRQQSTRLTHGQKLSHCKLVNAYDSTMAPIIKGKINCPAQFGRKPGIASKPAPGFIFATLVPSENPSDPSYVLPLLDKVQRAIEHIRTGPKRQVHSVAGDLGLNDATLRQAVHAHGILTVGIAQTVEPIEVHPTAQGVLDSLNEGELKPPTHPISSASRLRQWP